MSRIAPWLISTDQLTVVEGLDLTTPIPNYTRATLPTDPVLGLLAMTTDSPRLWWADGSEWNEVLTEKGTRSVESFGAVGDGITDDSAAIQAAIDSNVPKILFNPSGTYKFNTAVTIPALPNTNGLSAGREIDGQGSKIVGANGIANCFVLTSADSPLNHNNLRFHGFVFDGTVTGAFILFHSAQAWFNRFWDLRVREGASGLALLQLYNDAAQAPSQPGGWTIYNLRSSLQATLLLSMEVGAAPQFDDFNISDIYGGDPAFSDSSGAIVINTGCVLTDSIVQNIFCGGRHGINAYGGYIQKSVIQRVLVEIPPKADYPGSNTATNYGIQGDLKNCTVHEVHMNFPNVTDNPGVCCIYAIVNDSHIDNLSMNATGTGTIPYAGAPGTSYPALNIAQGNNVTFNFPPEYLDNGVTHGSTGACTNITYLGGVMETGMNATSALDPWYVRGGVVNNYGQGAVAAVITLPAVAAGNSVRFVMMGDGGAAYSIKAAPGNKIILNGTPLDDGDKITCASPAVGNIVQLRAVRTGADPGVEWLYDWMAVTEGGTWTDGGA